MVGLMGERREKNTAVIDAAYLKVHRTATSMGVKKGGYERQLTCETLRPKTGQFSLL